MQTETPVRFCLLDKSYKSNKTGVSQVTDSQETQTFQHFRKPSGVSTTLKCTKDIWACLSTSGQNSPGVGTPVSGLGDLWEDREQIIWMRGSVGASWGESVQGFSPGL